MNPAFMARGAIHHLKDQATQWSEGYPYYNSWWVSESFRADNNVGSGWGWSDFWDRHANLMGRRRR